MTITQHHFYYKKRDADNETVCINKEVKGECTSDIRIGDFHANFLVFGLKVNYRRVDKFDEFH